MLEFLIRGVPFTVLLCRGFLDFRAIFRITGGRGLDVGNPGNPVHSMAAAEKGEGKIAPNGNLVCLLRVGGVGAEGRDSVSLGWAVVSSKRRRSRVLLKCDSVKCGIFRAAEVRGGRNHCGGGPGPNY